MNSRAYTAIAAIVTLCLPPPAAAQTVYRCGPDGRTYSHTPCADGRAVAVDDARSAGQQRQAREVATQDAEQARKLADERQRREDAAKGQAAAGFMTAPASALAASTPQSKPKTERKAKAGKPGKAQATTKTATKTAAKPPATTVSR